MLNKLLPNRSNEDNFTMETNDLLIVFDDTQRTSDIRPITTITGDSVICAGYYKVPLQDCEITTGRDGRNFFYRAPRQSVIETERLAQLEKNLVLAQITSYKPPVLPSAMDWTKVLLFALIFVAFIVIGFAI